MAKGHWYSPLCAPSAAWLAASAALGVVARSIRAAPALGESRAGFIVFLAFHHEDSGSLGLGVGWKPGQAMSGNNNNKVEVVVWLQHVAE